MVKSHTDLDKSSVLNLQLYEGNIKVVISIPISVFFFNLLHYYSTQSFLKNFFLSHSHENLSF